MAIVSFDPDVFGSQLNNLTEIADSFGDAQTQLQSVVGDYWTAQSALNQFKAPQDGVVDDLVVAFNNIKTSFENLAVDLHGVRAALVEADMVSAEDLNDITESLEELDDKIDAIDAVVSPQQNLGGPYPIPV